MIASDFAKIAGSCVNIFDDECSTSSGFRDALRDDNTELRFARLDGGINMTGSSCVGISPVAV